MTESKKATRVHVGFSYTMSDEIREIAKKRGYTSHKLVRLVMKRFLKRQREKEQAQ